MKIFLYVIATLLPIIVLALTDLKNNLTEKNRKNIVKTIVKDFLLIILLTPTTEVLIYRYTNVINPVKQNYLFLLIHFITGLLIGFIYLLIKYQVKKLFILEKIEFKNKHKVYAYYYFSLFFMLIGIFAIFGTIWAKNTYNNITIDQLLITMFSPKTGTDPVILLAFYEQSILVSVALTYVFGLIFYKRVNYRFVRNNKIITERFTRLSSFVLSLALLLSGLTYGAIKFDIKTFLMSITQTSTYIENNYVDPGEVNLSFPNKKRNLIHIYLESIENSYLSIEEGGNMQENLMPNLLELSKEGYSFSHLEKGNKHGGPLETYGSNWSVASMVNQFFGFPMKTPTSRNNYGKSGHFYPGAVGIGDILQKMGYEQTMMIGADADFGGLTYMFEDHGNFKIMDHQYALKNHMLPTDNYKVNWGYEDEKLYKFAKDELTRLYNTGKPFHFVMENADSHFPGFAFDGDKPIFGANNRYVNYGKTIKFSEKHMVDFIRWIQKQPFYENTTIVLIGDHLSMDKKFFIENDFNNYLRTTFNLILNPISTLDVSDDSRFYNRTWSNYDMMPTLLSSIGVKINGERVGLGTNLFSKEDTLFERDGFKYVNNEYIKRSKFYNKQLLNGKINYTGQNLTLY